MADPAESKNFPIRIEGDFSDPFFLVAARVREGMSRLTETTLEFVCPNPEVDLERLLGQKMTAILRDADGVERAFPGTCVSVEYAGSTGGLAHYVAELRPWLWFLGRSRDCRVFQDMKIEAIIREVLSDYGFSSYLTSKLNATYEPREFTVQYRETDLDFLSRLMEEEGIYYYFTEEGGSETMVIADGIASHESIPFGEPVPFRPRDESGRARGGRITEWASGLGVTSGKVSLEEYNFEIPRADMLSSKEMPQGTHSFRSEEIFDYPGRYAATALGDTRARIRMEAEAVRHKTAWGAGDFSGLYIGRKFGVSDLRRDSDGEADAWLLTEAEHLMQTRIPAGHLPGRGTEVGSLLRLMPGGGDDEYRVEFSAIPATVQYRAPLVTPWPEIPGVQTAVVVGPSGQEIHTDKYGRVKVQFHWDRYGKTDDKSSCWVRCMMPWTGKQWGAAFWPRIGQEVVVQFEEGNPDRPVIVGMLYNADMMPPYAMPDNQTQSGIKTQSSPDGRGFNELMLEDKKGWELFRIQAERDFRQIVKNDAEITVGLEHKDKGDMRLEVHRNLTETVNTGNHSFTVASGNQTLKVKKDKTETVEGDSTLTVTGNVAETVEQGNRTEDIKMGNVTRTLDMGSESTTLKVGDFTLDVKLGKIGMTAMQEIKLTCGASTITMTPADIKIKAPVVTVQGDAMAEMKAPVTTVQGDAMAQVKSPVTQVNGDATLILKGGLTMIN